MTARTYASPVAFKRALEDRLRGASQGGLALARRRQLLVFDRFLARVAATFGDDVVLKGGLVLELRLERARATRDIDLWLPASGDVVLAKLQVAGQLSLGDYMTFEVTPDGDDPGVTGEGAQFEGFRYQAQCLVAGKVYGQPFGVDVAMGDPILGDVEVFTGKDTLAFAGVAPPTIRLYPVETHLAEKLHAFTLPRQRPNSRVKDLPDLALLASIRNLEARDLGAALKRVFQFRRAQALPERLPAAPAEWAGPYARLAEQADLPWRTLAEVESAVRDFLDPLLAGEVDGHWSPVTWTWVGKMR